MSKRGWLNKEGGQLFKNWKRRFSVLDASTGTLSYFETEDTSGKPMGVVVVKGSTVSLLAKDAKKKENCFVISTAERTFFAQAVSRTDAESWVDALKKISADTSDHSKDVKDDENANISLYAGWLHKEAGSGINWRKRFFILTKKKLSYYKDRSV
ncbi:MAG: hypothetical protein EZS28_024804 [Streblomastix strix]|uniref:PH domain-containing protein n=1 Tax=Streblomastix strix TaxID=222440 RepID=A0A5J4VAT1_9EUKA|nr:MAG: hypothetical protein EZS28_024804 [Streblomastix strix]